MAIRDINYFKSRFETGDVPVQDTFHDLFDTIWFVPVTVNIRGSLVVDPNEPKHSLFFEIDFATDADFSNIVLRSSTTTVAPIPDNSSSSSSLMSGETVDPWPRVPAYTKWEFWNGISFIELGVAGLPPAYQNANTGLVSFTWTGAEKCTVYYVRYRSGFEYTWSDYVCEKVGA